MSLLEKPLPFAKFSGAGNDFILIDDRNQELTEILRPLIPSLCHRQKGVGADGLILLQKSNTDQADYSTRIFNADGSEAEMCGNGIRCLGRFIAMIEGDRTNFSIATVDRILRLRVSEEEVEVEMGDPIDLQWDQQVEIEEVQWSFDSMNTGVPHVVAFVDDIKAVNLERLGPLVRFHSLFRPRGTNVNFASVDSEGRIRLRTYERGVEGETLACGTGATATALAAAKRFELLSPIELETGSGDLLTISYVLKNETFSSVTMTGPATYLFRGELPLNVFSSKLALSLSR